MVIEIYEAFRDAGVDNEKAKRLARAFESYIDELFKLRVNQSNGERRQENLTLTEPKAEVVVNSNTQ